MAEGAKIKEIAERLSGSGPLFVVDVKVTAAGEIEVLIDSDESVTIDDCVRLSKAIEGELDRETEDFSLTVSSAGIGQPLKVLRQYRKLNGKPVEIVLRNGTKILATLENATDDTLTVSYPEKVAVAGKKKKETVQTVREIPWDEIKSTVEYLDFK